MSKTSMKSISKLLPDDIQSLSLNSSQPNSSAAYQEQQLQQQIESLFDPSTLSPSLMENIPAGYILRPLCSNDYEKGYKDCLVQLTTAGDLSETSFIDRFKWIKKRAEEYRIIVIEDESIGKIVASGSILIERKFIRGCGLVGHIEDIVVDKDQRGKNFGKRLIEQLTDIGKNSGCYKIILCCDEKNVGFYEKCGYTKKEVEMVHYFT